MLELALVIALVGLFIAPLVRLQHSNRAAHEQSALDQEAKLVDQAMQGFVMAHGRLPCPAAGDSLKESRVDEQCIQASGKLPLGTLGLPLTPFRDWELVVATLEAAGMPAEQQLFKDDVLTDLSLQALTEIILQPQTPNNGLEESALPAIHLCLHDPKKPLPQLDARGCGTHQLHSPTAVAVFYAKQHLPTFNQGRTHQFFIEPHLNEPVMRWISFEQFIWLRTMSGRSI